MGIRRQLIVTAAIALAAAACSPTTDTTTTLPAGTTSTAIARATTTQVAPPTALTTTTQQRQDPWAITVVPVKDYVGSDTELGIEEIVTAQAMIRATIVSIGAPGIGWCCENPPLQVADIDVLGGEFPGDSDGKLNGIGYQILDEKLNRGDRVTMLMRDDSVALFIFDDDEGLAHPAPQQQADAIEAMRVREAQLAGGLDPLEYSPLRAVTDIWDRYRSDWWGPTDQRVALALSGVPGYPTICSAADLGRTLAVVDYPPANEGLPFTVARSRDEIVDAATACDYDEILSLTTFVDGDDTDLFWWSGGSTSDILVEADRRFGAMRELVFAMTNSAYATQEVNAPNSSGDDVDQTFYIWPSAAVLITEKNAGRPTVETLGEEEAVRVAALADMTVEELDEIVRQFRGYALFRTAIDTAGRWRFALTGD